MRSTDAAQKEHRLRIVLQSVLTGTAIVLVGTIPRNLLVVANLRFLTGVPWAVPFVAAYLWLFWWYLKGGGPPASTARMRCEALRANLLSGKVWLWALIAGGLAIVGLVLVLRVANRLVVLPQQELPDLSGVPDVTVLSLLLVSAPFAGVVEESAFRGYMQGPIERLLGLPVAILITGTAFALVHLDFELVLWPYYVGVAAIYGMVTYLSNSILPAIVLHTGGNIFSSLDLWLYGQSEWQTSAGPRVLIWETGPDMSFWLSALLLLAVGGAATGAYVMLARTARTE